MPILEWATCFCARESDLTESALEKRLGYSLPIMRGHVCGRPERMKYWEIIADWLSAAGWSTGYSSAQTPLGFLHIVDARDRHNRRFIVRSDEKLTAFLELERLTNSQPAN
jgi:hypothetical protein